jgi:predicted MPP superfamily phosphohydrolase
VFKLVGCLGRLAGRLLKVALILALLAYPFLEPYWLQVEQRTLYYDQLPPAFDGLRIAFMSDLHVGPFFSRDRLDALLTRVAALQPDLLLLGGDYADDSSGALALFREGPLFAAPMGVYAVLGNHDRVMPESNLPKLLAAMQADGVTPLYNEVRRISRGGQAIYLAGVDDYGNGHPDIAGVAAATRADAFTIFLLHNPDGIPKALAAPDGQGRTGWADLMLCGHTHGGQVTLFGQKALILDINRETGERFRTGWKREQGSDILVTNGVGTSFLPIRFFARPQVHIITLRSGQ